MNPHAIPSDLETLNLHVRSLELEIAARREAGASVECQLRRLRSLKLARVVAKAAK